jgi:hypothetical protein
VDSDKPPVRLLEVVSCSVPPTDSDPDDAETLNALELRFVERSPRTCRRWAKRPEIAAAVKARAGEQVAGARAILASGMSRAARSLVNMADGAAKADAATVAAARCVVEQTTKLVELSDLQQQLADIQQQLAALPGGQSNTYRRP